MRRFQRASYRQLVFIFAIPAFALLLSACPPPLDTANSVAMTDGLPPSVAFTSPTAGGTYCGIMTFTGTLTDDAVAAGDGQPSATLAIISWSTTRARGQGATWGGSAPSTDGLPALLPGCHTAAARGRVPHPLSGCDPKAGTCTRVPGGEQRTCWSGCSTGSRAWCWIWVPVLYLADAGELLYSFTSSKGFTALGRTPIGPVGAMAGTFDGRLYGAMGAGMCKLFCYDPSLGTVAGLGVAVSVFERRSSGYTFGDAVLGRDGEIIFGEDDDRGHLWLYYPRIRKEGKAR
jgi:hypothetical protein